jgi:Skp family chaperone for outer membrane proteins
MKKLLLSLLFFGSIATANDNSSNETDKILFVNAELISDMYANKCSDNLFKKEKYLNIINNIATKKKASGIISIYNKESLFPYINPKYDITNEVITELVKQGIL